MIQIRCRKRDCAIFFDKKLNVCPECETPRWGFNKPLRTAQLNNHLYAQAEAQGAK